jgi:hypothetical protein
LVPQYRHDLDGPGDREYDREGQVLRPSFDGIRDAVRDLLGMRIDMLARHFAATHDMKLKEEIERLGLEYDKLKEPWRFVSK